jgi:hypothetical protein
VFVCIAGVATETQAIYMTPVQARAYVLAAGRGVVDVADVARRSTVPDQVEQPATVAATYDRPGPAVPIDQRPLALTELAGHVGMNYDQLRQAIYRAQRNGDPLAPDVVGWSGNAALYLLADIRRYLSNRPKGSREPAAIDLRREVDGVDRSGVGNDG